MSNNLSRLFQPEPPTWGLRGDPYLWREMKETLGNRAYPLTEADFKALLEDTFQELTGSSTRARDDIYVEKYSHGGMSSGYVSMKFWRETAIPELLKRYREAQ